MRHDVITAAALVLTVATVLAGATPPITMRGWGAVKVGMTPAEASAALGSPLEIPQGESAFAAECHYRTTAGAPGLLFMVEDNRIVRVQTKRREYSTPTGVRVGDSEEQAIRAYTGRAEVRPHKYSPSGHYLVILASDGRHAVVVETDKGKVVAIRGGRRPAVEYVEGCL